MATCHYFKVRSGGRPRRFWGTASPRKSPEVPHKLKGTFLLVPVVVLLQPHRVMVKRRVPLLSCKIHPIGCHERPPIFWESSQAHRAGFGTEARRHQTDSLRRCRWKALLIALAAITVEPAMNPPTSPTRHDFVGRASTSPRWRTASAAAEAAEGVALGWKGSSNARSLATSSMSQATVATGSAAMEIRSPREARKGMASSMLRSTA